MDEVWWKDMSLTSTPAALHYYSLSPAAYHDHGAYLHQHYQLTTVIPRPPPPHTALTLSDSLELNYLGHSSDSTNVGSSNTRVAVQEVAAESDRRHRRKIKNRESAQRSRARKQAYTSGLEREVVQLRREITMLIKREQDLHARLALAAQVPDRCTLQKCRSAPAP